MSKSICSLLLPLTLFSMILGCSGATFQESKKDRTSVEEETDAPKKTPALQTKQLQPGIADLGQDKEGDENETRGALQPVEVSGSFLACIPTAQQEIGCAVVDRGIKHDLSRATLTWYGEDATGNGIALSGRRAANSDAFHSFIKIGPALTQIRVVVVEDDGDEKSYKAKVPQGSAGKAVSTEPIHLGNGDFSASSCADDLQQVPTYGDRIRFGVETDRQGPWLIRLHGICGVDSSARLAIRVMGNGDLYQTINQGAETEIAIWVPDVGSQWTVEVTAHGALTGDIEDFLFTDLSILGAGDIVLKAR